ncbi:GntR family transcriptional regulator [Herbiconiux moechotypicola]|uniref:GntR family transcriptional regulator n=1 Tax=Herbiconiux moechotypicola TaxID=637393 RepID=UPI00217EAF56|nr:GntR family transcriptional regulator [Herbiconiux moechotypicola]MCS5731580.1 GntR family transcriptional regulator [Herbiconiux moechotypicola]
MSTAIRDSLEPLQVKDVVYLRLRDRIVDHTFTPGESLREVALSELFGVSKTPIREALVRLEQDGLVEIAPYRGARVRVHTADDVRELFDARGILETECVRRAALTGDPDVIASLERNLAETAVALEADDLAAAAAGLDAFDDILFAMLDNKLLAGVFERLSLHLRLIGSLGATAERFAESLEFHRAIVEAIRDHDGAEAARAMRAHIASVRDRQIERLALEP